MDHWLQAIVKRKRTLERLRVPLETNLTLLAAVMLWSESMHKVRVSLVHACSRLQRHSGHAFSQSCRRMHGNTAPCASHFLIRPNTTHIHTECRRQLLLARERLMGRLAEHLTAMGDAPSALANSRGASASPGGTSGGVGPSASPGETAGSDALGDMAQELADALCANFAKQVRPGTRGVASGRCPCCHASRVWAPASATASGVQPALQHT